MKKSDKTSLKNQSAADIKNLLQSAREELFTLTMDLKRNKVKNTSAIHTKRKDIARMLTVIREKDLISEEK